MKSKLTQFILGCLPVAAAFIAAAVLMLGAVPSAYAQTNGNAGGFVPCGNSVSDPCTIGDLFRGFIVIVNYLIVMAGFVAVLAIVYAGFLMVWSRGDDGGGLKEAKGRMSGAVIGLVLVAAAFILINALFAGSFSIGVCNGELILTDPEAYINQAGGC